MDLADVFRALWDGIALVATVAIAIVGFLLRLRHNDIQRIDHEKEVLEGKIENVKLEMKNEIDEETSDLWRALGKTVPRPEVMEMIQSLRTGQEETSKMLAEIRQILLNR